MGFVPPDVDAKISVIINYMQALNKRKVRAVPPRHHIDICTLLEHSLRGLDSSEQH